MIRIVKSIAAAGALLLATGVVASAQTEMKLDVPFSFHTPTATMPAGKYFITELGANRSLPFFRIQQAETGKSVVVVAPANASRKNSFRYLPAQVAFRCAGDYCAISEIYAAASVTGYTVRVDLNKAPKGAELATVLIPALTE